MSGDTIRSGMDSGAPAPSLARAEPIEIPAPRPHGVFVCADDRKDHFIVRDGVRCAGTHLLIELYEGERLDDLDHIDAALRACVAASGATLLHLHLHHFEPNGGVSGVAVLAESHISIHTWPEAGYAALDAFMCGEANPEACVPVLEAAFRGRVEVSTVLRGKAAARLARAA